MWSWSARRSAFSHTQYTYEESVYHWNTIQILTNDNTLEFVGKISYLRITEADCIVRSVMESECECVRCAVSTLQHSPLSIQSNIPIHSPATIKSHTRDATRCDYLWFFGNAANNNTTTRTQTQRSHSLSLDSLFFIAASLPLRLRLLCGNRKFMLCLCSSAAPHTLIHTPTHPKRESIQIFYVCWQKTVWFWWQRHYVDEFWNTLFHIIEDINPNLVCFIDVPTQLQIK